MNHRFIIPALVIWFVAASANSWSQEHVKTGHRHESLIDLFQHRLCGFLCNGHRPTKGEHRADVKKAVAQKTPVQKKAVPKDPSQKGHCRREVSDRQVACRPCGLIDARPLMDRVNRWSGSLVAPLTRSKHSTPVNGGKLRARGEPVRRFGEVCDGHPELPPRPLFPIPEVEKPHLEINPFLDDALPPSPEPGVGVREATDRVAPRRTDPMARSAHRPIVQQAVHYDLSDHFGLEDAIRPID